SGSVLIRSGAGTGVIILAAGELAGAYTSESRDISDKPDRALALCDDPNAMIEVKSADATKHPPLQVDEIVGGQRGRPAAPSSFAPAPAADPAAATNPTVPVMPAVQPEPPTAQIPTTPFSNYGQPAAAAPVAPGERGGAPPQPPPLAAGVGPWGGGFGGFGGWAPKRARGGAGALSPARRGPPPTPPSPPRGGRPATDRRLRAAAQHRRR